MKDTANTVSNRQSRQRSALNRAIAYCQTIKAMADALEVSYQTVQGWRETGVPLERCAQIETLCKGKVQCHELNEDWLRITTRPYGRRTRYVA